MDWKSPPRHSRSFNSDKAVFKVDLTAIKMKLQKSKNWSLLNVEKKLIIEIKSSPQFQAILKGLKNNITITKSANKSSKDNNTTTSRKRNLDNSFIDEVSDSSVGRALCTSNRSIMVEDVYEDSTSTDNSNFPVQEVHLI